MSLCGGRSRVAWEKGVRAWLCSESPAISSSKTWDKQPHLTEVNYSFKIG